MKHCKNCGKEVISKHKHVVFCSHKCANIYTAPKRMKVINLICKNCGNEFNKTPGELKYRKEIKFCSKKCSSEYISISKRVNIKCDYCGNEIFKLKSRIKNTNFCNNECASKYRKDNPPRKANGYWLENGYKVIYTGNGKGRKEHILIMENHIGRELNKNECVHHKNKDILDNRLENLELTTISDHAKLHRKEKNSSF